MASVRAQRQRKLKRRRKQAEQAEVRSAAQLKKLREKLLNRSLIVKVQRSLFATTDKPAQVSARMLIYDETREIHYEADLTAAVAAAVGARAKRYFHAHVDGEGLLHLDNVAPDQDW